ncbi:MAG: hypothetical protein M1827_005450 [Pycnora praestabilis]|nr:MAG: hypothetical protein M1827_005450 [Pycnora praestabilis]
MARVTRAALRSNVVLSDETETLNSLPATAPTVIKDRLPLGILDTNNTDEVPTTEHTQDTEIVETAKKDVVQGQKAKGPKKVKKQQPSIADEVAVPPTTDDQVSPTSNISEVLEDRNVAEPVKAIEEACDELRKPSNGAKHQTPMHDGPPTTPASSAVRAAQRNLIKAETPRFDPESHQTKVDQQQEDTASIEREQKEDSFIREIGSRTPARMTRTETFEDDKQPEKQQEETGREDMKEDSFVETIVTRSPAKPVTRIEDSVEAIDALEDAIEQVDQALPAVVVPSLVVPSPKPKIHTAETRNSAIKSHQGVTGGPGAKTVRSTTREVKPSARAKSSNAEASKPAAKSKAVKSNTSKDHAEGKQSSPTTKEGATRPTNIPTKKLSVPALLRAPPPTAKSTKVLTRPSFELPGDAISRKLKEQREERLRREEEETQKKREFKARPVRKSIAPTVKPTVASKARASLMHGQLLPNDHTPRIRAPRPSTANLDRDGRRQSVLSVTKRSSIAANSSARRTPSITASGDSASKGPSFTGTTTARNPSTTGPSKATVSAVEAAQQKQRAKEIVSRPKIEKEEREKARKEKEDAAKKAREQAAERGRQASREWAERQKMKVKGTRASAGLETVMA